MGTASNLSAPFEYSDAYLLRWAFSGTINTGPHESKIFTHLSYSLISFYNMGAATTAKYSEDDLPVYVPMPW